MKIAVIGDVHANLPALEAALAHARTHDVEAIWNVGDFVGYGAFPDEVVQRLRREATLSIIGNYDVKVLHFMEREAGWRERKHPQKFLAFQWAHDNLSAASRAYLRSLPEEHRMAMAGRRFLLTHGSPASNEEHLRLTTPESRLRELAHMALADVIICGHSHEAFDREVDGVRFINPGSVGRPDDGDPRASYAILEVDASGLRCAHYRVVYDVERAAAAIRERGLPEAFAQMVLQGRDLDTVLSSVESHNPSALDPGDQEAYLDAVFQLAEACDYEEEHAEQVTRLALMLFDELLPLHDFGAQERFWLECAGLLHDIGWLEGQQGHNKTSLRLILDELGPPFSDSERLIVGAIARYHRGALPSESHDHFAALTLEDQYTVSVLAGILRVADGLDRSHWSLVEDLFCTISEGRILVRCEVRRTAEAERYAALKKGALLEQVFSRRLAVEWVVL